nr:CST complex subunit TEN1 [Misgurnus anguillicaudatus]
MNMLPHPAVFHLPWEINALTEGASVRTYGRLTSYQPEESRVVLSAQQSSKKCQVSVRTTFVEPFHPIYGAQYLVLGEVEKTEGVSEVVLCARALNCVDGVDLALIQRAITEQRCFFEERRPENSVQASQNENPHPP